MNIYTESEIKDAKYPVAKAYEAASFIIQDRTGKTVKLSSNSTSHFPADKLFTLSEINDITHVILAEAWVGAKKVSPPSR